MGYTAQGLLNVITDSRGKTTRLTYNPQGQVTSVTNARGYPTQLNYAPNGLDVASVVNAQGQTVAQYSYNDKHQPTHIVSDPDGLNKSVDLTYTMWGALSGSSSEQGQTGLSYDGASQLSSVSYAPTGGSSFTAARYTYDPMGRVQSITDATDATISVQYNDLDKPTRVTYPDGTFTTMEYACCRMIGAVTDRAGRKTYYDYDPLKRLARIQDAQGNSVQYDYDAVGNLSQLIDGRGTVTSFAYDEMNRLARKSYADGTYEATEYDAPNNLMSHRDTQGRVTTSRYDENGNLTNIDYPSSPSVSVVYDSLDRPTKLTDALGDTDYSYDASGRLTSLHEAWANDTLSYGYDAKSRLASTKIDNTDTNAYAYDTLNRVSRLTSPAGMWTPSYNGNTSEVSSLALPNGSTTNYAYDSLHRLTQVSAQKGNGQNGLISQYGYGYETGNYLKQGVRTWMERQVGDTNPTTNPTQHVNYSYDAVGQLTGEASAETQALPNSPYLNRSYSYDPMGNRLQSHSGALGNSGTTSSGNSNKLNQLTQLTSTFASGNAETFGFDYDASGNLTSHSTTANQSRYFYGYDDQDRLTNVIHRNAQGVNDHKSEYVYDSFSRKRISREYGWDSSANSGAGDWVLVPNSEIRRIYQGMDVVQERDSSNRVLASYTRAGNIGGLLARTEKANTPGNASGTDQSYYYHYDGSGNVVQLTDAAQNTVADYAYDAYGNTTQAVGAKASQPYRFSTKEWQSASGLYDFGFRFYNPSLGRWLNLDPMREGGGLNLYAAFGNSPTNFTDSYGLCLTGPQMLGIVALGFGLALTGAAPLFIIGAGIALGVGFGLSNAYNANSSYSPLAALGDGITGAAAAGTGGQLGYAALAALAWLQNSQCFVAGTKTLDAHGKTIAIEKVKKGMWVSSRDPKTKKLVRGRVTHTSVRTTASTLWLWLGDQHGQFIEKIGTTSEHPFYVEGKGFVPAKSLGIGTSIVTRAGPSVRVLKTELRHEKVLVYNFTVEGTHTYFVGQSQVWVHNIDCNDSDSVIGAREYANIRRELGNEAEPKLRDHLESLGVELAPKANSSLPGPDAVRTGGTDLGWDFAELKPLGGVDNGTMQTAARWDGGYSRGALYYWSYDHATETFSFSGPHLSLF